MSESSGILHLYLTSCFIYYSQVFDCDFTSNSVQYEHNGSPLLHDDVIKMRAFILFENRTVQVGDY